MSNVEQKRCKFYLGVICPVNYDIVRSHNTITFVPVTHKYVCKEGCCPYYNENNLAYVKMFEPKESNHEKKN